MWLIWRTLLFFITLACKVVIPSKQNQRDMEGPMLLCRPLTVRCFKGAYLTKEGKVTDGIVLLHSSAHSHVVHGVQEQEMPCTELCLNILHTAQAYCCVIFMSLNC